MGGEKPREIALELLEAREKRGAFIEQLLEQALTRGHLKGEDRRFLQELVYGVIRWQLTLDWLVAEKTGGKPQKSRVQNLLRLALYQMFWLERVPGYAAVNESVEICKRRGLVGEAKFVNAVLRGYGREAEGTRAALAKAKEERLHIGYSHPEWLCGRWVERWGKVRTVELLEWNNAPPPIYARVNTLKTSAGELLELWKEEGVEWSETNFDWAPRETVFLLLRHPPLGKLRSFTEGHFYVQDPSTLLAVHLLGAQRGEAILDLCSAPGGKSTYLAQLLRNEARILAQDLDAERLRRVEENVKRLGADCVTTHGEEFPADAAFDRVLVDAPCSNTGVMRRRIELRWRVRPEEIQRLASAQLKLLKEAAGRTRIGGVVVYSTCSLEREENEAVLREFLGGHPRFALEEERFLTPMDHGVDGAYAARLVHRG